MRHVFFAINPSASGLDLGSFAAVAQRQLAHHRVSLFVPQSVAEFGKLRHLIAQHKPDIIVVVGGDGTTNLFLSSLMDSANPVYLFPSGTANDLARHSGHLADWDLLNNSLVALDSEAIDILEVNGLPFATVGGFGVGSALTALMNDMRRDHQAFKCLSRALGKHSYPLLGLSVIGSGAYDVIEADLTIGHGGNGNHGGYTERVRSGCILVANQPALGGNLMVCDDATNTDGAMDIMILRDPSRIGLLRALANMHQGLRPVDASLIRCESATLHVRADQQATFFADGETLCSANHFHFAVRRAALRLLKPAHTLGSGL